MTKNIGIIGLGAVGVLLARHLLEDNFQVSGYDILTGRMDAIEGLTTRTSPGDVADNCEILITPLPSVQALWDVMEGEGGILKTPKPRQILLETSTFSVADKLAARKK